MPHPFDIRQEIELPADPDQVWDAIATGPGVASWLFPVEGDPAATATEADRPRRLLTRTPEAADGSFHAFEYLVEGRDGGTSLLRFVHSGVAAEEWGDEFEAMAALGWTMYLHTLAEYLGHFPGRYATYVLAEGPPASAGEKAWPVLLEALGLPVADSGREPAAAVGSTVRLTPAGLPPVEGVLDHGGEHFVGVRTSDALYRFHDKALLGQPVAAGHHLFAAGVDAEAEAAAWTSWLRRVYA